MKVLRRPPLKPPRSLVWLVYNAVEPRLTVAGRVRSVRILSSKLMFLDIERDTSRLQVMVELKKLTPEDGLNEDFKAFKKVARIGDWIGQFRP